MAALCTFLDLVDICDNFHINTFDAERLFPFTLGPSPTSPVVGLIRPTVLAQLRSEINQSTDRQELAVWSIQDTESSRPRVSFASWITTPSMRTEAVKEVCERWRDTGLFEDTVAPNKWRGELYPVYRDPFGVHDGMEDGNDNTNYAFEMERAAAALFGVVTYGVHMTIYHDSEDGMKIWVPTRASTKQTWVSKQLLISLPPHVPLEMSPL
jgi:hypothetical protein